MMYVVDNKHNGLRLCDGARRSPRIPALSRIALRGASSESVVIVGFAFDVIRRYYGLRRRLRTFLRYGGPEADLDQDVQPGLL